MYSFLFSLHQLICLLCQHQVIYKPKEQITFTLNSVVITAGEPGVEEPRYAAKTKMLKWVGKYTWTPCPRKIYVWETLKVLGNKIQNPQQKAGEKAHNKTGAKLTLN